MNDDAPRPETEQPDPARRRRFFRRAGIAALVAGLAGGVGWKAYAQGGWHGWHRHSHPALTDPAPFDRHLEGMLGWLYGHVGATEEQKRKLAPIVKGAAKDLLPLHDKVHEARRRSIALLTAENVDPAALESLRAEHLKLADDASRRLTQAIAEVSQVLTPAQRKTLAAGFGRPRRRWYHEMG